MKKSVFAVTGICCAALFLSCATTQNAARPPLWTDAATIHQIYPEETYLTGIADGSTEDEARTMADGNLAAYFSKEISSSTQANRKISNTGINEASINQEVTVKSRVLLAGVEHTEGWYNKQERNWYVCAYLDRAKAWKIYENNVIQEKNRFYSFYNSAESEPDPFKKIALYKKAASEGVHYSEVLSFAEILYKKGCEQYSDDRVVISSIEQKITETSLNLRMAVEISGDIGINYKGVIEKVLSDHGFLVSDKNCSYTVKAAVNSNKKKFTDTLTADPTIDIRIINPKETVRTLSKAADRISGYSDAEGLVDKRIDTEVTKVIQEDFSEMIEKLSE
jgi:hypothetical protein